MNSTTTQTSGLPAAPGSPCWCCGSPAKEKHHIKPRRNNGSDHPSNLIDLCIECHDVVDCPEQPNKMMLERIEKYPRIQILMAVRVMADNANRRAVARVEQETLQWAIRVLEHPTDTKALPKLKGAVTELRTRYKRSMGNHPA